MRLKTRCVDGTNYDKIVQHKTTGNSMLSYASDALDGVEVIGDRKLVAMGGGVK